jgi:hypothetical protein
MKKPTRKQVLAVAGALVVLLIVLGVWLFRPDPQMAKVKALQQELSAAGGADRRQKWQQLGEELRKLTPGQRQALRGDFRKRRQEQLSRYFTLSKEEKTRWLDEQINRMEAMRRSGQANGRGGNGPNPPVPGGRNLSPDEREQRRRTMLDQTTPEERAQRDQFLHDLNARRLQRGLGGFGGWR